MKLYSRLLSVFRLFDGYLECGEGLACLCTIPVIEYAFFDCCILGETVIDMRKK